MASPTVVGTNVSNIATATTAPSINLPASVAAGDGLIVAVVCAGATTVTFPAGWDKIYEDSPSAASDVIAIATRTATGGETAVVLTTSSLTTGGLSWRITGHMPWSTQQPQISTVSTGGTNTPDPPNFNFPDGSKDYLLLWLTAIEGEQTLPPTGNPANYTSNILGAGTGSAGAVTNNARIFSASRQATLASEDAGGWTLSNTGNWAAMLLVIHPAGAGAQTLAATAAEFAAQVITPTVLAGATSIVATSGQATFEAITAFIAIAQSMAATSVLGTFEAVTPTLTAGGVTLPATSAEALFEAGSVSIPGTATPVLAVRRYVYHWRRDVFRGRVA